eukprot:TRINITY_DN2449_c0_g1_i1.p1 TRINITY_DN2449_c0_g1~~TRINITY_DN2449_c0_g1_i1.p1  ORF type:complete len:570 (+),score=148.02 TRINITY_DN2449_c0_g1_i1:84-1712(+)
MADQFRDVTHTDEETAKAFLAACGGDVGGAIDLYLRTADTGGSRDAGADWPRDSSKGPAERGDRVGGGAGAEEEGGSSRRQRSVALCVGGSPDMYAHLQRCLSDSAREGGRALSAHSLASYEALRLGVEGVVDEILSGQLPVAAVVPFSDGVVPLCDQVCRVLSIAGNDPSTSALRTDKLLMQEACRDAGIRWARSVCVRQFSEDVIAAAVAECGGWPVVVKPPRAAGSEGVTVCHCVSDVSSLQHYLRRLTTEGAYIDALVVQEYLSGDEYVVNTVSWEGRHWVTDVWLSRKDDRLCYDRQELVTDCSSAELGSVVEYTRSVLQAVGLTAGAAHTEVMNTPQGPTLVEVNARAQGDVPRATQVVGYDQMGAISWAISQPQRLDCLPAVYCSDGSAVVWVVFLLCPANGYLVTAVLSEVRALPTHRRMCRTHWEEATVRHHRYIPVLRTVDLNTCPGAVLLSGPLEAVEADAARLRSEIEPRLFVPAEQVEQQRPDAQQDAELPPGTAGGPEHGRPPGTAGGPEHGRPPGTAGPDKGGCAER